MTRAPRRLLALCVVVGALVTLTGAPASAHASLLSTDPVQGSVVATVPDQVVLTFNEPIRVHEVTAFDATGDDWPVDARAEDNRVVVTPSADPGQGTVVVAWSVVSSDGHIVSGALTFSIGAATTGGPADASAGAPTSLAVSRGVVAGLAVLGLLVSIGLTLTGRSPRWADLAYNIGLVAAVLLAPLHELAEIGRGPTGLTDWVVWLDGFFRLPSLLLLGAYAVAAVLRSTRRVAAYALLLPVGVLTIATIATWPTAAEGPPGSAAASSAQGGPSTGPSADPSTDPSTGSAALGDAGTVRVAATPAGGRTVTIGLAVVDPNGAPLNPFAVPTLTIRNDKLSLGDAALTQTGTGTYSAELTIPTSGDWTASVSVRTSEFDNPVAVVPFTVP